MQKYFLHQGKNGEIITSENSELQVFYLNKNAVIIYAENIESAKQKYIGIAAHNFYPVNLNLAQ